jgi:pimeloyl-ACP methyl ester carboxylesterase
VRFSASAHTFGVDDSLVGVVTQPTAIDSTVDRPAVILLNAGIVHKVGPFRLTVQIARTLAARGFTVLRFDLSGFGDSRAVGVKRAIEEQVVIDGRAAMDFLESRYGFKRFIIGGLCSGAVYSHYIAAADTRVAGMWMLDGYAYPTRAYRRFKLKRALKRLMSPRELLTRLLDRGTSGRPRAAAAQAGDGDESIFYQAWPAIDAARSGVEKMLARGARVLFVYTGGWSTFVEERQFGEMFPSFADHPGVELRYYPHADHTYLSLSDRAVMIADLTSFVETMALPKCAEPGETPTTDVVGVAAVRLFGRS